MNRENKGKELLSRFGKAKEKRRVYENTLQDITNYIMSSRGDFTVSGTPGLNNNTTVYESTPTEVSNRLASIFSTTLTSSSSRWFALKAQQPLVYGINSKRWVEAVERVMLSVFNSSESNFGSQNHEVFLSLVTYGTAAMFVQEDDENHIRFGAIHLSEIFYLEDQYGEPDTVFRKFSFSARQAAQAFGKENLSDNIQKVLDKDPDQMFEFVHCVYPAEEDDGLYSKMEYASYYIECQSQKIVKSGGFYYKPYIIPRFYKRTGELLGRSPAWDVLSSIKNINKLKQLILQSTELKTRPPLLVEDDGILFGRQLQVKPSAIIRGGLRNGMPAIQGLNMGIDLANMQALLEYEIARIREAFFVDQTYFKEGTPLSATEFSARNAEKLQSLTPAINRIVSEYLNELIEVVFTILYYRGDFGEMPDELKVKGFKVCDVIEYLSPLAKLQDLNLIQSGQRWLAAVSPVAQIVPGVFDSVDLTKYSASVAEAVGLPASVIRSPEEIEAIAQQKAQAEQQAQMQQQQAQLLGQFSGNLTKPVL